MNENNMSLWNSVFRTDPQHTKRVTDGGAQPFTSIAPYSQVARATELWGPAGDRWGLEDVEYDLVHLGADEVLLTCRATLYYPNGDKKCRVEGHADSVRLFYKTSKGYMKVDEDAWKKARTGVRSKALSELGFNGDVFMGMFDDVRYVEHARRQAQEERATPPRQRVAGRDYTEERNGELRERRGSITPPRRR